jgi:F0F1-type ATP synthase epsilon subunit
MSSLKVDIVTAERTVYSDEVDIVIAPGVQPASW